MKHLSPQVTQEQRVGIKPTVQLPLRMSRNHFAYHATMVATLTQIHNRALNRRQNRVRLDAIDDQRCSRTVLATSMCGTRKHP